MGQTGGFAKKPGGSSLVQCLAESKNSITPGKRTLVEQVQRRSDAEVPGGGVHTVAVRGLAAPETKLPFLDLIQASFGNAHDLSKVKAHIGGAAEEASNAMGASAYATGDHVAFAKQPDLHTAAHEAAHVVQQAQGVNLSGGIGQAEVQLKDGVGQAGDPHEQHADAVADAVVAGQSAEPLLSAFAGSGGSAGVQRQAAGASAVDVTVEWSSPFGNDLDGKVTLSGSNDKKSWTKLDAQDVAASHDVTFAGVAYFKFYRASVHPIDVPHDKEHQAVGQFRETKITSDAAVAAGATHATIKGGLELNPWNKENVRQRHEKHGIDPDKADKAHIKTRQLFGRPVQVHELLVPRVVATEACYQALPPGKKTAIAESLFVTGGYAYRNEQGKKGSYSRHSVGMAIDVNYNEGKEQNARMEDENELALLEKLVQPVVQTDPAHAKFDVWKDKGQAQLEASHVFNERFPMFLADLLDRPDDVTNLVAGDVAADVAAAATDALTLFGFGMSADSVRKQTIRDIFATITPSILMKAAKHQQNAKKKQQLKLIAANWDSLSSWILGAHVVDEHAGQRDAANKPLPHENKIAVGMIPLDETVLQMFLDTGWTWGGDWGKPHRGGRRKDYMHFEDATLESQIKKP